MEWVCWEIVVHWFSKYLLSSCSMPVLFKVLGTHQWTKQTISALTELTFYCGGGRWGGGGNGEMCCGEKQSRGQGGTRGRSWVLRKLRPCRAREWAAQTSGESVGGTGGCKWTWGRRIPGDSEKWHWWGGGLAGAWNQVSLSPLWRPLL